MPRGCLRLPEPQSWVGVAAGSAAVALSASDAGSQSSGQLLALQKSPGHRRDLLLCQHWSRTHLEG